MTEKYFISHTRKDDYQKFFSDFNTRRKVEILFIHAKLEEQDKLILSSNIDGNKKISLDFSQITEFKPKILLINIEADNEISKNFIESNLKNNLANFQNSSIIRINYYHNFVNNFDNIFNKYDNIFEIMANLFGIGAVGEFNYINNELKILQFPISDIFTEAKFKIENIGNKIKKNINDFTDFIRNNKLQESLNLKDLEIMLQNDYFNNKNQNNYIENYFSDQNYIIKNQLKNPANFQVIFQEIVDYIRHQNSMDGYIIQVFLKHNLWATEFQNKINASDLSNLVAKIKLLVSIYCKTSDNIQANINNAFIQALNQVNQTSIAEFLIMVFAENIILSEMKIDFRKFINENIEILNKSLDLGKILNKNGRVIYKNFYYDDECDFSFNKDSVVAYFNNLDKDFLKEYLYEKIPSINPLNLIFKKYFINDIIKNSNSFVVIALANFIVAKFDDIEKNRLRDFISAKLFSDEFYTENADKVKALKSLLPIEVQQKIK
ncbi:MAG: hypothetical protein ACKO46_01205 [Alphaproteobacteria bacterium]